MNINTNKRNSIKVLEQQIFYLNTYRYTRKHYVNFAFGNKGMVLFSWYNHTENRYGFNVKSFNIVIE